MHMSEEQAPTSRYKGIANLFALSALSSESYTQIDRLANALNQETVRQVVYEISRNLDVMKRQGTLEMHDELNEKGYHQLVATVRQKEAQPARYVFFGTANDETWRNFLDEASSNLSIARKIGAFAMSIVATQRLRRA